MTTEALKSVERSVERMDQLLAGYSNGDRLDNLVDLLIDAMHWCEGQGEDFLYFFDNAVDFYLGERDDELNSERSHS